MTDKDLPSKALKFGVANDKKPGPGETNLDKLIQTLNPVLDPVPYIWVSLPVGESVPPILSSSIIHTFAEPYFPDSANENPTPSAGLLSQSESAPKTRITFVLPQPALNAFTSSTMRLGIDDNTLGLAQGSETAFPCRMISCRVQSSLNAVGMLAKISKELTAEGIPSNVVSAFFHDYLFVPEDDADLAMDVLLDLVDEAREKAGLPPLDEDYNPGDEEEDEEDDDGDYDDENEDEDEEEDDDNDIDQSDDNEDKAGKAENDVGEEDGTEKVRKQLQKASVEDEGNA